MQVRYWQDSFTLYEHAVEATKNNFRMHTNYGIFLKQREEFDKAVMHFREALRINPRYSKAHNNLGKVLLKQENFDEAIRCFSAVLLIEDMNLPEVYGDMGLAYAYLGKDNLAITNMTKSIELDPNSTKSLNNLAWVLATTKDTKLRNPTDAVKYAQRVCELSDPNQPTVWDTLAAAYAAAGNFPEAVKTAEKAIKLAEAADEKNLAKEIQERLYLYKSDQPYRER
jgi:Flp pilus assembly protein TadD